MSPFFITVVETDKSGCSQTRGSNLKHDILWRAKEEPNANRSPKQQQEIISQEHDKMFMSWLIS
jgi:hypothetical protein